MQFRLDNAKLVAGTKGQTGIEFDVPGIEPVIFEGMSELRLVQPETGLRRELTEMESRDFEECIEQFMTLTLARALAKHLKQSY